MAQNGIGIAVFGIDVDPVQNLRIANLGRFYIKEEPLPHRHFHLLFGYPNSNFYDIVAGIGNRKANDAGIAGARFHRFLIHQDLACKTPSRSLKLQAGGLQHIGIPRRTHAKDQCECDHDGLDRDHCLNDDLLAGSLQGTILFLRFLVFFRHSPQHPVSFPQEARS